MVSVLMLTILGRLLFSVELFYAMDRIGSNKKSLTFYYVSGFF